MRRTFLLTVAFCLCLHLMAQMDSRLSFRRYTTQDGLPQMQTERLWQDSKGYIYVGTLSGFVRFDGHSFTPFLKGRRTNIVGFGETDGEVRALGFFRQWTVLFDRIEPHPLDPQGHWLLNNLNAGGLPQDYVLMEDSLEEHRRLCRMKHEGFELVLAADLLDRMTPDRKLFFNPANKEAIVPLEDGVYRLTTAKENPVKLTNRGNIYTLLRTDSTLLAFASDGVYTMGADSLTLLVQADWSNASYGLTVRPLRSGGVVVADEHTVYFWDGQGASPITPLFTGLNLIRDLLVDRWNRLWVASYQGVYCFFNCCFTNHQLTDENDIVRAVSTTRDGRLVMGTLNGKLLIDNEKRTIRSNTGQALSTVNYQFSILNDNPEQFYAPSAVRIGNDVFMAGNGDITRVNLSADGVIASQWLGFPRDRYQFVASAWGQLVVGTRNSILLYDPETARLDTLTTQILHPWCAAQDAENNLWIGSSSGLFRITEDGKVSKKEYEQKLVISTMDANSRGTIFFASVDSLFMLLRNEIIPLSSQIPELEGHEIRSLHVSPRGYLVLAVVDGLFVCCLDDDYRMGTIRFFNHLNGFTLTEPLKATMAETDDGTIWLPGLEGMTSFRPADLLSFSEEETYIQPPLRWWQRWWIWLLGLLLLALGVWAVTHWYEKRRARRRMIQLEWEKLKREQQIAAIRQKAINTEPVQLAKDIVKMTEKTTAQRLTLRTASGTIIVDTADIAFFKADGNYSQIVTFQGHDTVLIGLGALERMLDPVVFVRADRSTLVNIHNVSRLLPRQRRCILRSPRGQEVETTLLAPAFGRLQRLL